MTPRVRAWRLRAPGVTGALVALARAALYAASATAQEAPVEPRLRAEIHGPTDLRFTLIGAAPPVRTAAWRLTDGRGAPVAVAEVRVGSGGAGSVLPAAPLDPMRVHYLEIPGLGLRTLVRRDPIFRTLLSSKPLGSRVSEDGKETTFRIFSPRADSVRLYLYRERDDSPSEAIRVVDMAKDTDGVWEADAPGDLHGAWYDFTVHGPEDPGNWFYETRPSRVSDPYALVNDDALGKSRVWRDGPPPPPVAGGRPRMEDVVAYEVHVQDFGDLLPVPGAEAGTLPAMARAGLRNRAGEPVGFDHLAGLGVNVVHLMPMQEFLHYPDAAWQAAFADDAFAKAMAIDRESYQWGYCTTHAFAVESRYRSRGTENGAEREQFKAFVRAFHERGLSVIVDLVANHTGENIDHRYLYFGFNVLDLPYYFRTDDDVDHIGPFGNEIKTEERPMVRRWILDQMRHWMDALGVDGFRVDLAGQMDKQTLLWLKSQLPPDVVLYGEPWIAPSDPDVRANPDWAWYKADAPITFFQDDARNAFQGSPFDVADRGYAGGDERKREDAMRALANAYAEEPRSTAGISYLDIHDNWALADRYALTNYNGLEGVDEAAVRLAAGFLLTSAGPVVIHGGTEMLRSKGLAPLEKFTVQAAGGPIEFKGRDDTYNVRAPNRFLWEGLAPGSPQAAMRDWWKGLVGLRMSEAGSVFRVADVPEGHYRWIAPADPRLLGYVVGGRVIVLANVGQADGTFRVELPQGSWLRVSDGERVDLAGVGGRYALLSGGSQQVTLPKKSFWVWVRERG